jgi:hypothetical protein
MALTVNLPVRLMLAPFFKELRKKQQDRQCTNNVTLRRVRETTVAMKMQ